MIRFFILWLISLVLFVLATISVIASEFMYTIVPCFFIIGLFPSVYMCILFGIKEMSMSFSLSHKKNYSKDILLKANNFLEIFGKVTWISGIVSFVVGVILLLRNLEYADRIGPNMSLTLYSLIYCAIINLIIIIPNIIIVKKQLKE